VAQSSAGGRCCVTITAVNRIALALVAALIVLGGLYLLMNRDPSVEPVTVSAPEVSTPAPPPTVARDVPKLPTAPPPVARPRADEPPPIEEPPAPIVEEAAPEAGTLHIDADVPGAQVFLDRQFVGTVPATASDLKPGTYQLNVSVEGYDGIAQTIDVERGPRNLMVRFKEVRLSLQLSVIHKHRMGSCRGRLLATPHGVRYETDDKNDSFSVAMDEMERFEIDYLKKNLKIKLRKGKQYNFTDPEGNADRLFVFHRDVEKARERLNKGDAPAL
jgi:hypothetical protein